MRFLNGILDFFRFDCLFRFSFKLLGEKIGFVVSLVFFFTNLIRLFKVIVFLVLVFMLCACRYYFILE